MSSLGGDPQFNSWRPMTDDEQRNFVSERRDKIARRVITVGILTVFLCATWIFFTSSTRFGIHNNWAFVTMFVVGVLTIIVMRVDINRLVREEREARERAIKELNKHV
jgi:uncharacterized membrane protein